MHIILWEFVVPADARERFQQAYGPDGDWAQLFRRAKGYLGTELLHSDTAPEVFLTIDRWETASHFESFQRNFGREYRELDQKLEGISTSERKIGVFSAVDPI
ncbi:antibiotic biosynthesis monooxygenase family protein [Terriglobus sp. ADX1]|uniref:antibiotic biosynthesis monooxygenase family protein n=1 Tax=Terriglobus sp. ADX1 TaxID=2794063 RepID=UPI002FE5414D